MDSLKKALQNAKHDTTRLRIYLAIGDSCDVEKNLLYALPALKIADNLLAQTSDVKVRKRLLEQKIGAFNLISLYYSASSKTDWNKVMECEKEILKIHEDAKDTAKIIEGYRGLSWYYLSTGNFPKAIEFIQKALTVSKEMNYKKGTALCLAQLGDMYRDQGENTQALENYQNALLILSKTKDTNDLFNVLGAVGGFYYTLHNTEKALEYYNRLIELCNAKKDIEHNVGSVYKWIGIVYRDNKDYENSLLNYKKSLSIVEGKDWVQEMIVLDAIGEVYNEMGDFTKAIEYHSKAIKIAERLKSEEDLGRSYTFLARVYFKQKKYKSAHEYSVLGLSISKKNANINPVKEAELLASQIDSASGDGMGAYSHYKEYISL